MKALSDFTLAPDTVRVEKEEDEELTKMAKEAFRVV